MCIFDFTKSKDYCIFCKRLKQLLHVLRFASKPLDTAWKKTRENPLYLKAVPDLPLSFVVSFKQINNLIYLMNIFEHKSRVLFLSKLRPPLSEGLNFGT